MADTKNVVLVTGANTDMGWELVKSLLQFNNPYHIFLGCRSIEKREAGIKTLHTDVPTTNSTVELFRVGLESDDSISSAFEKVKPELSGNNASP